MKYRPSKPYLGFVAAASGCLDEVLNKERGLSNGDGLNSLVDGIDGVSI